MGDSRRRSCRVIALSLASVPATTNLVMEIRRPSRCTHANPGGALTSGHENTIFCTCRNDYMSSTSKQKVCPNMARASATRILMQSQDDGTCIMCSYVAET
jgi:hypothetical protein